MNRRDFFPIASAAAASCLVPRRLCSQSAAAPISATFAIDESSPLVTIPPDFTGLSYESAQLANPDFFSAENTALISLFRELGHGGVLRLGGGTSEFTAFNAKEPPPAAPFDAVGPDTSKNVKSDTPITPKSLHNLRAFLDASGWRCLYGLNLGRGPIDRAAEEASYVEKILGPRLIAFQLGNEPDAWRNRYRPATWSYADFWKGWVAAHAAIVARVPQARFAGPDVSNKMAYVTGFAADAKRSAPDVIMLTSHYYAMGPAGRPGMTIDRLLSPDPKLDHDLEIAMNAARGAGLPYRVSEGNSCWNGGEPGVSDTFASALWAVDIMLQFAAGGCSGICLHGGGSGFYTPIAGSLATGFVRRPEFFGIRLFKPLVGATIVRSRLDCANDRLRAYAARRSDSTIMIVINKTSQSATIRTSLHRARKQWQLTAPAIDAKQGVLLTESDLDGLHKNLLHVPAFTAVLLET